jgi:hypothetical protein
MFRVKQWNNERLNQSLDGGARNGATMTVFVFLSCPQPGVKAQRKWIQGRHILPYIELKLQK